MFSIKQLCRGMAMAGTTVALLTSAAAQTGKKFTIKGTLKDMADMPSMVYLKYDGKINDLPEDSAAVVNGQFRFSGTVNEPAPVNISAQSVAAEKLAAEAKKAEGGGDPFSYGRRNYLVSVVVDEGELDLVCTHYLDEREKTVSGNGAKAQQDYVAAQLAIKPAMDSLLRLISSPDFKNSDPQLKRLVFQKAMDLIIPMAEAGASFAAQHPQSPVSPYLLYSASGLHLNDYSRNRMLEPFRLDSIFHLLPVAAQEGISGRLTTENIDSSKRTVAAKDANAKKALVGEKAKDFTINDTKGKPVSLSSFRGKYVLVDFWASWCVPCRAENPNVVRAFEAYKDKGFTILGVSLDALSARDAWLEAIKKDGLTWTQVSDLKGFTSSDVAKLYGVDAIPQNFLIDPNGVIVGKNLRGEALQNKLAEIIK